MTIALLFRGASSLAFFALVAGASGAGATPVRADKSADCRANPEDPYDEGWRVPLAAASPYQGQCIDVTRKRPARVLSLTSRSLRFANFHFQGDFYEIEVTRGSIQRVIFQTENFTPVGPIQPAHTQLRFVLSSRLPATLRHQYGPRRGEVVGRVTDFVMSVDFMAPKGVGYSPLEGFNFFGLRGHYMNTYRFVSTLDRYQDSVLGNGHVLRQYQLKLDARQMDQLLLLGARTSHERDINDVYDVLWLNCTTEAFRMVALATGSSSLRWTPSLWYVFDPVAARAVDLLREAELIAAELPTLNDEWASFGIRPRAVSR